MFFTIQKSMDNNKIIRTNIVIKLSVNNLPKKYMTTADTLKNKWKKVTNGCLKSNK